tara:strand:+ start:81 stop:758 length:678 start_codon:yes stop_codon:yes gene_type:complete
MTIDLNNPIYQGGGDYEPIPDKTIATMIINIEADDSSGQSYRRSKNTDAVYMKCKIVVTSGQYAKRWFYHNMTLSGGKTNGDGQSMAGIISGKTIRQIVESARGINSRATDEASVMARVINEYTDIHGLEFCGRIGIEPERPPYSAKNKLSAALPADHKDYMRPNGASTIAQVSPVAAAPGVEPAGQGGVQVGPDMSQVAPAAPAAPVGQATLGTPSGQPSWLQE